MFTRSHRSNRPSVVVDPSSPPAERLWHIQREYTAVDTAGRERLTRIGFLWNPRVVLDRTGPFTGSGAQVASEALAVELASHSEAINMDIFAPITSIDACRQHFQDLPPHVYGAETAVAHLFPESELPRQIGANGYSVMHDPGTDLTRLSYVRSRLAQRIFPVTCSQHGSSYSFQLHGQLVPLLTAQIYPCDAVVCLTQSSRRALENRLAEVADQYSRAWGRVAPPLPRMELIPWGVDTERFTPRDQAAARRDLGLPLDRPILLCVGRLRIQDKMDWTPLLLAFERVLRTVKERPLLAIAGSNPSDYGGQVVAHAKQLGIGDSLYTFFDLPPACLPSLYAACDVFVSATDSPSESFGLTIVEAMACGRPVVASDWDGYKELIVHGDTGFKVRTDWVDCFGEMNELSPFLAWDQQHLHVGQSVSVDVAQLAGYMAQLVVNPGLRGEMGRQGRARVEALYDWRVVVNQWQAMWKELTAIARTLEPKEPRHLEYLQHKSFEYFSHYASRLIDDTTTVSLTSRGKGLLTGKGPLLLYPWSEGFLQPQFLYATLSALKSAGWLRAGLEVGELVSILDIVHGLGRDRALMHVMWLAKYDLISLGAGDLTPCEQSTDRPADGQQAMPME